jgi:hypothetical protein
VREANEFWRTPKLVVAVATAVLLLAALWIFERLRPGFPDVL